MFDKLKGLLIASERNEVAEEKLVKRNNKKGDQQVQQNVETTQPPIVQQDIQKPMSKEVTQPMEQAKSILNLQSVATSKGGATQVTLVEPRVYAEVRDIADHLKSRRSVIVNLHRVEHDQKKRIIDFLSGTVYVISGDIQRVGADIYLCTPADVEVTGEISTLLNMEEF